MTSIVGGRCGVINDFKKRNESLMLRENKGFKFKFAYWPDLKKLKIKIYNTEVVLLVAAFWK